MSSIKLIPTSGGGSVSLVPPNSTSGSDVTITLPTVSQTLPVGPVLEQFFYPCNGETVTTLAGDIVLPNVTGEQLGTSTHVDLTGSTISYTPPAGTKTVIYKFQFVMEKHGDSEQIGHFKAYIDSDEITKANFNARGEDIGLLNTFEWPIRIGGTADTTTGRVASWTSAKTLKLTMREYSSSFEVKAHTLEHSEGSGTDSFAMPRIGITALNT